MHSSGSGSIHKSDQGEESNRLLIPLDMESNKARGQRVGERAL